MKNHTISISAFLAFVLSTSLVFAKGGGVIGSGGDGLYLNNPTTQSEGDVVVPVPGDLQQWGTFTLIGEPGAGQVDHYSLVTCDPTDSAKTNCSYKSHILNETVKLRPGTIISEVRYSSTVTNFKNTGNYPIIRVGTNTTLKLKKITVPKIDTSYTFQVFNDITDPDTLEKVYSFYYWHTGLITAEYLPDGNIANPIQVVTAQIFGMQTAMYDSNWKITGVNLNESNIRTFCQQALNYKFANAEALIRICNAEEKIQQQLLNGKEISMYDILKLLVTPNADGSLQQTYTLNFTVVCNVNSSPGISCNDGLFLGNFYWNVTDPVDGDFVSVLPGVYGINFTASDGKKSQVLGIHVD